MEEQGGRAEDSTVASEKREGEKRKGGYFFFGDAFLYVSLERKLDGREKERDVDLSIFPEKA